MQSQILQVMLRNFEPYFKLKKNADDKIEIENIEGLTEVIINRPNEILLDIKGKFEKKEDKNFTQQFCHNFAKQVATDMNLFFNVNVPHLSCAIPDTNIRVQALHSSVTRSGNTALALRIPNNNIFPLEQFKLGEELIKNNIDYQFFKDIIINHKNILVSGGTGSGKTSFINAMLAYLPINERIVTIEDSAELQIQNPNCVNIIVSKNDQTAYSYKDGLNDSMRLRPDRILVGEIDTRNTMLFLRLSNTGHEGMVSTIHSNSVKEAIDAITLNAKFDGSDIDISNLVKYFAKAIDYVIQIKREKQHRTIQEVLDIKNHYKKLLNTDLLSI